MNEIRCSNNFNFNNYYKERGHTLVGNNVEIKNIKGIFNYNTVIMQSKIFLCFTLFSFRSGKEEEEKKIIIKAKEAENEE